MESLTIWRGNSEKRSENRLKNTMLILCLTILSFMASIFFDRLFILKQGIMIALIVLFMYLLFNVHIIKDIVLSLIFDALLLSTDYLVLWVMVSLFHNMDEMTLKHPVEGMLLSAMSKILLFIFVIISGKRFGNINNNVLSSLEWLKFLFFPLFSIAMIMVLLLSAGGIRNQSEENVFIAIALGLAVMNIFVFYLLNDTAKHEMEIRKNRIFRLKAKNQMDMYETISENFEKQRKRVHEYRNEIMCIESLLSDKKYDELERYVGSIGGKLRGELDYIRTNNSIVDAILNSIYRKTIEEGIDFIFQISDLSDIRISDEDIVIILSNLLNNAVEACEKCDGKKYIKMKLVNENGQLIISVKNSYNGELNVQRRDYLTSKNDDSLSHGIGIKNIIETIEKYHGTYAIRHDDGEFYFAILISAK